MSGVSVGVRKRVNAVAPRALAGKPGMQFTPHQYTELQRKLGSEVLLNDCAIDRPNTLKAAHFRADIDGRVVRPDRNYISIVSHVDGGKVWSSDDRNIGVAGSVTVQPLREHTLWHCDRAVEFVQIYVPKAHIRHVLQHKLEKEYDEDDIVNLIGTHDPELTGLVRYAQERLFEEDEPSDTLLDSWSMVLADAVIRRASVHTEWRARTSQGKIAQSRIHRVIDYIDSNLDGDLSLSAMSKEAALSSYHFCRSFKASVGCSPHSFVMQRRIDRAKQLLAHNRLTLAQIAYACGFSSQSHMTTKFKKHVGVTPGQYRAESL